MKAKTGAVVPLTRLPSVCAVGGTASLAGGPVTDIVQFYPDCLTLLVQKLTREYTRELPLAGVQVL